MDPEVIFILVIILFSILEGAARKRKRRGQELPGTRPPGPPPGWPSPGDFPQEEESGQRLTGSIQAAPEETRPRETAEGLVAEDLWEEIAVLARGDVEETLRRRRQKARGAPQPSKPDPPSTPTYAEPSPSRTPASVSETKGPDWSHEPRPTEKATPSYQSGEVTVPPGPASSAAPLGTPNVGQTEAPRAALRDRVQKKAPKVPRTEEQLHHAFRGRHALRHAMIAREIFGRPMALREQGDADLWSI